MNPGKTVRTILYHILESIHDYLMTWWLSSKSPHIIDTLLDKLTDYTAKLLYNWR